VKTPRADFIREIQSRFFKKETDGLGSLDWDRSRGTDFRCLLTILWCIDRYKTSFSSFTNIGSIAQFEPFLNDPNPLSQALRDELMFTFQILENMVTGLDPEISSPFRMTASDFAGIPGASTKAKIKVSPVEFICMYLLVFIWKEQASPREMSRAIRDMRRNVRMEHMDIRTNTKVSKTMVTFIKSLSPAKYQCSDDTDAEPAVGQMKFTGRAKTNKSESALSKTKSKSTEASSSKRKRRDEDDLMSPVVTKPRTNSVSASWKTNSVGTLPNSPTTTQQHNVAHTSLTAAIATANSSSPAGSQAVPTPTPTRGKGGLANLRALTQLRGKSGTSSNGDEG
jgi:hypothetical protein